MIKPLRSVLYIPGSKQRALQKAQDLLADGFIFDLEDGVVSEYKREACREVLDNLVQRDYGYRERVIRVNGLGTLWGYEDLVCVATSGADAILLPKVDGAETVRQAEAILMGAGAPDTLDLWCMIETPLGVLNVRDIVQASSRLRVLVMGTSDLTHDLQARHTWDRMPLMTSLGLCVLAARGYGRRILDGVHLDLDDEDGFIVACQQAKALGFDGKTLVHPKTITTTNTLFSPTADEVHNAQRIIRTYEEASARGQAVITLDGKVLEALHVLDARRLLEMVACLKSTTELSTKG